MVAGLEIRAGQRTMSGLIVDLTGQTFVLPVILTGQNSVVLKKGKKCKVPANQLLQLLFIESLCIAEL